MVSVEISTQSGHYNMHCDLSIAIHVCIEKYTNLQVGQ